MLIVSDTTPIISLVKVNYLYILNLLFGKIFIPEAVYNELTENPIYVEEAEQIRNCDFILCEPVHNKEAVKILRNVTGLDAGESEAIVLYNELNADFLIMDERKGRKIAKQLELKHVGTIGILIQAFDEKFIDKNDIERCLAIFKEKGIRISDTLYQYVMKHIKDN